MHVRFDERNVETEVTADLLRHRQTKGAATDMVSLQPPRHIPTLPNHDLAFWALMSAPTSCGHGRRTNAATASVFPAALAAGACFHLEPKKALRDSLEENCPSGDQQ